MRMMDNFSLETDSVKMIQDDLNYYVECNQEPDFAENDLMYEDLELEEIMSIGDWGCSLSLSPPISICLCLRLSPPPLSLSLLSFAYMYVIHTDSLYTYTHVEQLIAKVAHLITFNEPISLWPYPIVFTLHEGTTNQRATVRNSVMMKHNIHVQSCISVVAYPSQHADLCQLTRLPC